MAGEVHSPGNLVLWFSTLSNLQRQAYLYRLYTSGVYCAVGYLSASQSVVARVVSDGCVCVSGRRFVNVSNKGCVWSSCLVHEGIRNTKRDESQLICCQVASLFLKNCGACAWRCMTKWSVRSKCLHKSKCNTMWCLFYDDVEQLQTRLEQFQRCSIRSFQVALVREWRNEGYNFSCKKAQVEMLLQDVVRKALLTLREIRDKCKLNQPKPLSHRTRTVSFAPLRARVFWEWVVMLREDGGLYQRQWYSSDSERLSLKQRGLACAWCTQAHCLSCGPHTWGQRDGLQQIWSMRKVGMFLTCYPPRCTP